MIVSILLFFIEPSVHLDRKGKNIYLSITELENLFLPFEIVLVAFVALIIQHPCFVVALVFHSVTTVIEFERAELIK